MTPRSTERSTIDGPAGALEIAQNVPEGTPRGIALVAHPHPLQGGTLDNKVAQTLAKTFYALGYVAVRFNFRGVGHSAGTFDDGVGEAADALAALRFAQARFDRGSRLPVVLTGFSFGAFVQTKVAPSVAAERLVLVGPAVRRMDAAVVPGDTRSSSTARRTTSFRCRMCSRGRGRDNCPSSCSPAAATSSTAGCLNCSEPLRECGMDTRWSPVPENDPQPVAAPAARSGTGNLAVLRVAGLRKSYGANEVVRGLSFEIRRGECFGLLGPNGAGDADDAALLPGADRARRGHDRNGGRADSPGGATGAGARGRGSAAG